MKVMENQLSVNKGAEAAGFSCVKGGEKYESSLN